MTRLVFLVLILLSGCTFERGGAVTLKVVVSDYPSVVSHGDTFPVIIDVLNIDEPLELNVTAPDGITVTETIGASFVILKVEIQEAEPTVQTILVELASGEQITTINLGFTVAGEKANEE